MKAVILAAGEGTRLKTSLQGKPKSLLRLSGLSIIERTLLTFSKYSVSDVIIILGHQGNILKDNIGDGKRYGVTINYIECKDWKNGNGSSLYSAKDALRGEDRFIVSMADLWFEPELIRQIMSNADQKDILYIDKRIEGKQTNEEATKVKVTSSGLIKEIGKDLTDFNAVDCGIFILSGDVFKALRESFGNGDYSLTGAIKLLAHRGKIAPHDIGNYEWQDIDTEDDLLEANRKLLSSLGKRKATERYLEEGVLYT